MDYEEENANELQFGKEFDGVHCLTNDEMFVLLADRKEHGTNLTESFEQTYLYVERLATTKIRTDSLILSQELKGKLQDLKLDRRDKKKVNLHPFEISSVANLIKDDDTTVDEIIRLLPSLSRFPDDQIQLVIKLVVDAKDGVGGLY